MRIFVWPLITWGFFFWFPKIEPSKRKRKDREKVREREKEKVGSDRTISSGVTSNQQITGQYAPSWYLGSP